MAIRIGEFEWGAIFDDSDFKKKVNDLLAYASKAAAKIEDVTKIEPFQVEVTGGAAGYFKEIVDTAKQAANQIANAQPFTAYEKQIQSVAKAEQHYVTVLARTGAESVFTAAAAKKLYEERVNLDKITEDLLGTEAKLPDVYGAITKGIGSLKVAVAATAASFALSAREAQKNIEAQDRLRSSVLAAQGDWGKWGPIMDKYIQDLVFSTQYTRSDATKALSMLVGQTRDVAASLEVMDAAMGHAALTGYPLSSSVRTITQVMSGNMRMLGNWLPEFKDMDAMMKKFPDPVDRVVYALNELRKIKPPEPQGWQLLSKQISELTLSLGYVVVEGMKPFMQIGARLVRFLRALTVTGFGKTAIKVVFFGTAIIGVLGTTVFLISKLKLLYGTLYTVGKAAGVAAAGLFTQSGAAAASAATSGAAAKGALGLAGALVLVAKILLPLWAAWEVGLKIAPKVTDWFLAMVGASKAFRQEVYKGNTANAERLSVMKKIFDVIGDIKVAQIELGKQQKIFTDPKAFREMLKGFITASDGMNKRLNAYEQALENVTLAEEKRTEVLATQADDINAVAQAEKDAEQAKAALGDVEKSLDLYRRRGLAQLTEYEQAQDALTKAQEEYVKILDDTEASGLAVTSAFNAMVEAGNNLKEMINELEGGTATLDERLEHIREAARAGGYEGIFRDAADAVGPFLGMIEEAVGRVTNLKNHMVLLPSDVTIAMSGLEASFESAKRKMIEAGKKGSIPWQRLHKLFEILMADLEDIKASFGGMAELEQQIDDIFRGFSDFGVDALRTLNQANAKLVNAMVTQWRRGKVEFKKVFQDIADMFLKLVIQAILEEMTKLLITKILKLFMLFDKRSNDLMAIRVGKDYAKYVMEGVTEGIGGAEFAATIPTSMAAAPASPSVTVTPTIVVNEPSPLTTIEFVDNKVDPRIRELQKSRTESV